MTAAAGQCHAAMPEDVRLTPSPGRDSWGFPWPLPPVGANCDLPRSHDDQDHAWRRAMRPAVEWPNATAPAAGAVEGNPVRDSGPYVDAMQALAQFDAAVHGLPGGGGQSTLGAQVVLSEVLLMTGCTPSGWESDEMVRMTIELPNETVQVIAGWIVRAWLAGQDAGR